MFIVSALIATAALVSPMDSQMGEEELQALALKKQLEQTDGTEESVQEIVIDDSIIDEFGFDLEEEEN